MKKTVLALAVIMSSSVMAADPTAKLVWSGFVPGSTLGSELVITGLGGGAIENGQLIVATDGTFTSTPIVVEAREYTAATSVIGGLKAAKWTLSSAQVSYSDGGPTDPAVVVRADGANWDVGSAIDGKDTLSIGIEQTKAYSDVQAGGSVQAQVTIVAEAEAVVVTP